MRNALVVTCVLLLAAPAAGQGIEQLAIDGNSVTANVSLSGGLGAELTLDFDSASGLTASSLGLSAATVNPLTVASRLPADVSVPAAFPVLVQVAPPVGGGLAFSGLYTLGLHTENLHFVTGSPLRLYVAHGGGNFEDATDFIGSGSYRVRGTGGSFSEFLIVADTRSLATARAAKFDALEDLLDAHASAISSSVLADLESQLAAARDALDGGDAAEAAELVETFAATVLSASGASIPDDWQASGGTVNVAGALRAAAGSLRFSLEL